jgi:hypothetical protein
MTPPRLPEIFFDTGALYPDKYILTRQKKSVFSQIKKGDGMLPPFEKFLK